MRRVSGFGPVFDEKFLRVYPGYEQYGCKVTLPMRILTKNFYDRPTLDVARDLVGKHLVRILDDGTELAGRIVETEAYTQDDPAFHGWGLLDRQTGLLKPEGRGRDLFGKPGTAYVYLTYGVHWLMNVVTDREGAGGGVLLRAVEPLEGLASMYARRAGARRDIDLANGPGKLAQAFAITGALHNTPCTKPPLYVRDSKEDPPLAVETSCRIGITRGVELPWRFYAADHPCVSRGVPSDIAQARKRMRRSRTR